MRPFAPFLMLLACLLGAAPPAVAQQPPSTWAVAHGTLAGPTDPMGGHLPPTPPDLSGAWMQIVVTATTVRLPVLGEVRSVTSALLRMDIEQQDRELTIRRRACALDVDSGTSMVQTLVPDAFVEAIPRTRSRARLTHTELGWRVDGWQEREVVGMRDEGTTMPADDRDPRVVDGDRDGAPGVSIRVRGLVSGEVWVAQRTVSRFRTADLTPDRIDGHVQWTADQVVLGATNRFLRGQNTSVPAEEPAAHRFQTRRVAEGTTCRQAVALSSQMFGFSFP
jgi:hypothetical protein